MNLPQVYTHVSGADATASGLNRVCPTSSGGRETGMTSSLQVALVGRWERGGMAGQPSHTQLLCSSHSQKLPGAFQDSCLESPTDRGA